MRKLKTLDEIGGGDIGCYAILGGIGIVDGLKSKTRKDFYKIIWLNDDRLILRRYRNRSTCSISRYPYFRQEAEIYTEKEMKALLKKEKNNG